MAQWFECKAKYERLTEDGTQKKVSEPYLVDALSFTEAEARITEELTPYISGEFVVDAVKKTNYAEIFRDEVDTQADKWYKVKINIITIDEKSGVEKRAGVNYLVHAADFQHAISNFLDKMTSLNDYEIFSVTETPIMDVFDVKFKLNEGQTEN